MISPVSIYLARNTRIGRAINHVIDTPVDDLQAAPFITACTLLCTYYGACAFALLAIATYAPRIVAAVIFILIATALLASGVRSLLRFGAQAGHPSNGGVR